MNPDRYHLTLTVDGRPVMHGWWADRDTVDRKFAAWKCESRTVAGARITLVDEETGIVLTTWPEEP